MLATLKDFTKQATTRTSQPHPEIFTRYWQNHTCSLPPEIDKIVPHGYLPLSTFCWTLEQRSQSWSQQPTVGIRGWLLDGFHKFVSCQERYEVDESKRASMHHQHTHMLVTLTFQIARGRVYNFSYKMIDYSKLQNTAIKSNMHIKNKNIRS